MTPDFIKMMGKMSANVTAVKTRLRELGWVSEDLPHKQTTDWYNESFPRIKLQVGYAGSLVIMYKTSEDRYIWESPIADGLLTATNEDLMEGLLYAEFDAKL